jgi:hypothetical protein
MNLSFARLLRTPSSERHILRRGDTDFAVLELHYLNQGTVQATLIIFEGSGLEEADVPDLLTSIDEVLLPEVHLNDHNLSFTVVIGRVLGAYQAEGRSNGTPDLADL